MTRLSMHIQDASQLAGRVYHWRRVDPVAAFTEPKILELETVQAAIAAKNPDSHESRDCRINQSGHPFRQRVPLQFQLSIPLS